MSTTYSLSEAGFLTGQSTAAINRAIDRKEISAHGKGRAANGARRIGRAEVRALAVIGTLDKDLTPAARRRVSSAIQRLPADKNKVELGLIEIRLKDADTRIHERLNHLQKLRNLVEPQSDGDPLIRGTASSVYAIAAFTEGQTIDEIMEDCKGLTQELIRVAVEYAAVYSRVGEPLPTRTFKRMLIDMADSGVWDIDGDGELLTT